MYPQPGIDHPTGFILLPGTYGCQSFASIIYVDIKQNKINIIRLTSLLVKLPLYRSSKNTNSNRSLLTILCNLIYGYTMVLKKTDQRYNRFRFDTGSLSLNYVATVRHRGSHPRDLLATPGALSGWLRLSGLVTDPIDLSQEDLKEALLLRESIHDMILSLISNQTPRHDDAYRINRAARFTVAVPQLDRRSHRILWATMDPLKACLAAIARDAITLLGDQTKQRLKMCANGSCRMLFLDVSPAHRRRWCAMSLCGNRTKVAMHRQRHRNTNHI